MGRLATNGGTKLRPCAPARSMIGSIGTRSLANTPLTTSFATETPMSSHRWAKRKMGSNRMRPQLHTPGEEWDNAWAQTIGNNTNLTAILNPKNANFGTFPKLKSPRLGGGPKQPLRRLKLPHPPSMPPSASNPPGPWLPSGRRRISKKKLKRQRMKKNEEKTAARDSNTTNKANTENTGWETKTSGSHFLETGPEETSEEDETFQEIRYSTPLPLHVLIQDTTALQVKDLERVKNELRTIFVVIEKTRSKLTKLRKKLGTKKDPTAMTTQQRVELAKLSTEVERRTKECNTITRKNEAIRLIINKNRLMIGNTKRGININSRTLERLRDSMQSMLKKDILVRNEKLARKIEKMKTKEEKESVQVDNEILRLSERLFLAKRLLTLKMPTMNASPRASIQDYQQAAVNAASEAGNIATHGESSDSIYDSNNNGISSHQRAENMLKDAESQIRRKLSPIAIKTMGAFARYSHEEETGAFTRKDQKKLLSKIARYNWRIAKHLLKVQRNEKVEHLHKLAWKRIVQDNNHLTDVNQFVNEYLIQERRNRSTIQMIERMNKSLNVINIENAKLKNALVEDKKLNQATRMKTANDITQWKKEIKIERTNKIKFENQRKHTHETVKLLKPSIDQLMVLVREYDPDGTYAIEQMNDISGAGHDHQIHTTMGFIESSIDSMLLIRSKNKNEQRIIKKQRDGGGGRVFSDKGSYHTGNVHHHHHKKKHSSNRSRKGAILASEYEIDHIIPTTYDKEILNGDKITSGNYSPYISYLSQPGLKYFVTIEQFNEKTTSAIPLNVNFQINCRQVFSDNLALVSTTTNNETTVGSVKHKKGAGTKQISSYPDPKDFPRSRTLNDAAVIIHAPIVRHNEGANFATQKYISEWRIKHQDQFLHTAFNTHPKLD